MTEQTSNPGVEGSETGKRIARDEAMENLRGTAAPGPGILHMVPIGEEGENLVAVGWWPAEDVAAFADDLYGRTGSHPDDLTPADDVMQTWCVMDADPEHDWVIRWGREFEGQPEAFEVTVLEGQW